MKKALFALALLVAPVTLIKASDGVKQLLELQEQPEQKPAQQEQVKTPNVFVKGFTFVKDGVTYSVVSVKNGVVTAYDKVTGKIEAITPQMILNLRDSVRSTIANYPLTALALTAFVAVKASEYYSDSLEAAKDEDDSF